MYVRRQLVHDVFTHESTTIGSADANEVPGTYVHRMNIGLSSGLGISFHSKHNTDVELHTDAVWQARDLFDQSNSMIQDYHEHAYRIEAGISIIYYITQTENKR